MNFKKCTDCKIELNLSMFHKNKARYDGLCNRCKNCERNRKIDKEVIKKRAAKYRSTDKSKKYHQERYLRLKDVYRKNTLKWRNENPEKQKELWRRSASKPEAKIRHVISEAKRRAKKLNATLDGFDREIEDIYKNRPEGYHVDHIVPLKHKDICGLHVPWNLQYLTAEENIKKNNKLDLKYIEN